MTTSLVVRDNISSTALIWRHFDHSTRELH